MHRHVIAVAFLGICTFASPIWADPPKKLLLVGQGPDGHPATTHEYVAGIKVLAKCLKPVAKLELLETRGDEPWKEGPELLDRVDGVVLFVSEGGRWMQNDPRRLDAFNRLARRGGAIVALHWAMGTKDAKNIDSCLRLLGGCHGGPDRKYQVLETDARFVEPRHSIASGVEPFRVRDEFYYQLKFVESSTKVRPVLQVTIDGAPQTVAWSWERPDGGRSFGFSGLHFHENWKLPQYRRLVTQGVLWTLRLPIPEGGIAVDVRDDDLKLKK